MEKINLKFKYKRDDYFKFFKYSFRSNSLIKKSLNKAFLTFLTIVFFSAVLFGFIDKHNWKDIVITALIAVLGWTILWIVYFRLIRLPLFIKKAAKKEFSLVENKEINIEVTPDFINEKTDNKEEKVSWNDIFKVDLYEDIIMLHIKDKKTEDISLKSYIIPVRSLEHINITPQEFVTLTKGYIEAN